MVIMHVPNYAIVKLISIIGVGTVAGFLLALLYRWLLLLLEQPLQRLRVHLQRETGIAAAAIGARNRVTAITRDQVIAKRIAHTKTLYESGYSLAIRKGNTNMETCVRPHDLTHIEEAFPSGRNTGSTMVRTGQRPFGNRGEYRVAGRRSRNARLDGRRRSDLKHCLTN